MSNFEAGPADDEPLFGHSQPCDQTKRCSLPALSRTAWNGVALGQLISLLISGTGVCSQYLSNNNVDIPTTQSTINYFLLAVLLVYKLARDGRWTLNVPLWKYALLGLADVEANYFAVKAYQYTNITSVMLLDCFTIPCVMLLSKLFLHAKFKWRHVVGIVLCLAGLCALVVADVDDAGSGSHSRSDVILGDALCLIASLFYSISNVGQEAAVKRFDILEFLGMLGLCGLVINTVQLAILERRELSHVVWNTEVILAFVGFSVLLFAMYCLTARFMATCDATVFNLSMLTSDAWGALWSVILFHHGLSWAYFVSLAVVVCGVVLYNTAGFATPPADSVRRLSDSGKHRPLPTSVDDDGPEPLPTQL